VYEIDSELGTTTILPYYMMNGCYVWVSMKEVFHMKQITIVISVLLLSISGCVSSRTWVNPKWNQRTVDVSDSLIKIEVISTVKSREQITVRVENNTSYRLKLGFNGQEDDNLTLRGVRVVVRSKSDGKVIVSKDLNNITGDDGFSYNPLFVSPLGVGIGYVHIPELRNFSDWSSFNISFKMKSWTIGVDTPGHWVED
jgi:hypothetical protein